jgi:hypothetical protein
MDVGDGVAAYAAVLATIVAVRQRHRLRPPVTVWFEVSEERELVVQVTNTGRRPVSVDFVGLSGAPWRPGRRIVGLPPRPGEPEVAALEPGRSTVRTIAKEALRQHVSGGRRWVYAGTALGTGRHRRIPGGVIGHIIEGPPG